MRNFTSIFLVIFLLFIVGCTSQKEKELSSENSKKATVSYIETPDNISSLLVKNTCIACHDTNKHKVGPSFRNISSKNYSVEKIIKLIVRPNPKNWPSYPEMIPIDDLNQDDARNIALWIKSLD